ncbi:MAG: nucleoside hydrolase [Candidatus Latescibacterota bacterium]|nr:nucleoside hydrolase [Candidatus Latescibacterota bacterium]
MKRVVLDMDPGVDDALALLYALATPDIEIAAITTVSGNVPVRLGTQNALKVLELAGADVPVYEGAAAPLTREPVHATHIHGDDGLGDTKLPASVAMSQGDAVSYLQDALNAPSAPHLVAIGPLTNLALAEFNHPGLLTKASSLTVMGGAVHVAGNAAPRSEFNFFADAEAAHSVLRARAQVRVVPLDVTRQVLLTAEVLQRHTKGEASAVAQFIRESTATPMLFASECHGHDGIYLHDPLAVALALGHLPAEWQRGWGDVETTGGLAHGQLVMDERPTRCDRDRIGVELEWASRVNADAFLELFFRRVLGGYR